MLLLRLLLLSFRFGYKCYLLQLYEWYCYFGYQWRYSSLHRKLVKFKSKFIREGFHVFEILDNNNCLFTDSVYISQPTQISAAVQTVDVICNALSTGSASLQVNGGTPPYNYLWSNADTSNIANNLSAGSYIFYVSDVNGCQLQGIASINQTSPIVSQTIISPSSCIDV